MLISYSDILDNQEYVYLNYHLKSLLKLTFAALHSAAVLQSRKVWNFLQIQNQQVQWLRKGRELWKDKKVTRVKEEDVCQNSKGRKHSE